MVNINLLPPEIKIKIKQAKQSANIFSICLVIALIFISLSVIGNSLKKSLIQPSLDDAKQKIEKANSQMGSLNKLEEQAIFLNEKANLAKSIESRRPQWSTILQELINSVPTSVQFTNLSADSQKNPNFVLQGKTTSEREIIKFSKKLENSLNFKDVAFKSSSKAASSSSDQETINFSLEFNLEQLSVKNSSSSGGAIK